MPENFVDGDMVQTGGSLKCRKISGTFEIHDFPVDGDMVPTGGSIKCRKFSGTFSGW